MEEIIGLLLAQKEMVWELVDPTGKSRPVGEDHAGLGEILRANSSLYLRGKNLHGEIWEIRWAGDGPVIRRSTRHTLPDETDELREEGFDARIDRRVLNAVLHHRRQGVDPVSYRAWAMASFIGRLYDLVAGIPNPYILEYGTGRAPYGLILYASLVRAGYSPRFVGVDASPSAVTAARELAGRLGLTEVELKVGELRNPADTLFPLSSPHLLFAVHLCGKAVYDLIALGVEAKARAQVIVPCCPPEGAWEEAGFSYRKTGFSSLIRARLDRLGLLLGCLDRLQAAGYHPEVFATYLPPWRETELGVAAYRPDPDGQTKKAGGESGDGQDQL